MSNIFVLLFLATVLLLVWGLVNPQQFVKFLPERLNSRTRIAGWFGGAAVLLFSLISVTAQPINEVTTIRTKTTQSCDPNYSGACVPIASDVDCGGGSGNGPAYVYGVVKVIGTDIYDLDRDGDGYGCE